MSRNSNRDRSIQILTMLMLAGCSGQTNTVAISPDDGTSCGKCEAGMVCNNGRCLLPCVREGDCGQCSSCKFGFCERYADFCVLGSDPANGAGDVRVDLPGVKIEFSEPVNEATLNGNVVLTLADGHIVAVANHLVSSKLTMELREPLAENSLYRLQVSENLQSEDGHHLTGGFSSSFSTGRKESETDDDGETEDKLKSTATYHRYDLETVSGRTFMGNTEIEVLGGKVMGITRGGEIQIEADIKNPQ